VVRRAKALQLAHRLQKMPATVPIKIQRWNCRSDEVKPKFADRCTRTQCSRSPFMKTYGLEFRNETKAVSKNLRTRRNAASSEQQFYGNLDSSRCVVIRVLRAKRCLDPTHRSIQPNGGFKSEMKTKFLVFVILLSVALPLSLSAQKAEIDPYGGFFWPGSGTNLGDLHSSQIVGVRGGYYFGSAFELGANWGWINHFQPSNDNLASAFAGHLGFPQNAVRANIYEAEFAYHFAHNVVGTAKAKPYVTFGIGALGVKTKDDGVFVLNVRPVATPVVTPPIVTPPAVTPPIVTLPDGESFVPNDVFGSSNYYFAISYGGGIKLNHVWGPMGFFADFRGRTMPNFFSNSLTWPELRGGLTFGWGAQ
jgi:hypothetical protein